MTIDTSALVAIVRAEPDGPRYLRALMASSARTISAGNLLETFLVVDSRRSPSLAFKLESILALLDLEVLPVTTEQVAIAREAYSRFGRGSGHPARLNFGDCFAYALARSRNEPLLFIGNDFSHTDITSAL